MSKDGKRIGEDGEKKISSKEISREVSLIKQKLMDYRARILRTIFKRLQEMGELGQS